ncbi:unnamed protein product [Angiostrongylus costaricensis]|uniref:SHSP domain-containing protein n=1 Tax=Angiostrongylus costaricensis TaxID=334426 RepID=A0A158PED1_ANGCS|nr:unnamed protein product [Angiostrongylus costaricensis]
MSLWVRPANILPRRFAVECLSDLRQLERKARHVERMLRDSLCRTVPNDVLDKSVIRRFYRCVKVQAEAFESQHVGRCLTIEGKEELEEENGYSMRVFTRQFLLPEDVNLDAIRSSLTDNGQLAVEAPKLTKSLQSGGETIPIQ